MQQHIQQSTGQSLAKKHTNTMYNGMTQVTSNAQVLNNGKSMYNNGQQQAIIQSQGNMN